MCLDPAFSSSKFAIMVAEWNRSEKQVRILYSEELDHPSYEEAIDQVFRIRKEMGNVQNIGVDASTRTYCIIEEIDRRKTSLAIHTG